jgi:NRAMP (natural resistance-associated macrophage protein)-like metal ion transporter
VSKDLLEKVVEAPAIGLERTLEAAEELGHNLKDPVPFLNAKNYWKMLGPGLTTGAADDDPSGIATYSQTGAQYGFKLLWLAPLTFPLMSLVQEMCARIGLVTGRGLAANIRRHFPRWVLYTSTLLLCVANTFNLGADLGAMAKATQLLWPQAHFSLLIIGFALLSLALQVFTTYDRYARYLKWLAMILLTYILSAFLSHLNWHEVLRGTFLPSFHFTKQEVILICAILGTTISPYLFFWQTSQEVEEGVLEGKKTIAQRQVTTKDDVKRMRVDVWSGMFLSNIVMFFIVAASAGTLFTHGITNISTAADAAKALEPIAGHAAYLLFTLGIIGTGMLGVPVLAGSSSYALAESFGWKEGLYKKLKQARAFYGAIIISMVLGLAMNFIGLDPIKALIYSAVANGLVAPIVLTLIVMISRDKRVMGEWVNSKATTFFGWLVTVIMIISGLAAIYSLATG